MHDAESSPHHRYRQVKAMIFDVDNTLYAYTPEIREHFERAFVKSARVCAVVDHLTDRQIIENGWKSYEETGDAGTLMARDHGADHRKIHWLHHKHGDPSSIQPNPHLRAMLETCRDEGIKLYAYSDAHHEWTRPVLERLGIADLFEDVLTRDGLESFVTKRDGDEGYRRLHGKAGCHPGQIVMVDDSERALKTAHDYGMFCVLNRKEPTHQPPVHDAHYDTPEAFLEDFLEARGRGAGAERIPLQPGPTGTGVPLG